MLRWAILGMAGCAAEKDPAPADTGACAGCGAETAPPDTAPPEETGDSAPSTETADSGGDTGADTAEPPACVGVSFTAADGAVEDLTAIFTKGDYHTLSEPGVLSFCPGEWYVRLTIAADVAVVGLGETREDTVLSGGEQASVLTIEGPAAVSLSRLTVERGAALGWGAQGGGVLCRNHGAVEMEDVIVRDNAAYDGGGLYAQHCEIAVRDAEFTGNRGEDDGGAASLWYATATFQGVLFQGNAVLEGGAIFAYQSEIVVEDSVFQQNEAHLGGAAGNYLGEMRFYRSEFLDNASDTQGGAVMSYGTVYAEDSRFEGNTAAEGGALSFTWTSASDTLEGVSCDFADNSPQDVSAYNQPGLALGKGSSFLCDIAGCAEM